VNYFAPLAHAERVPISREQVWSSLQGHGCLACAARKRILECQISEDAQVKQDESLTRNMVGFWNQVGTAPLTDWFSPLSQQISFGRGHDNASAYLTTFAPLVTHTHRENTAWDGFVAINNADSEWSTMFMMGLPAGSYCNVIDGLSQKGTCTGTAYISFPLLLPPPFNFGAVLLLPLMAAWLSPLAHTRRLHCI
jgi:hypothetical protein